MQLYLVEFKTKTNVSQYLVEFKTKTNGGKVGKFLT